jgi:DUF1680 family protein
MMERAQIFELMSELRLYGIKATYDEIMTIGIKRQISRRKSSAICCKPKSTKNKHARSSYTEKPCPISRRRTANGRIRGKLTAT